MDYLYIPCLLQNKPRPIFQAKYNSYFKLVTSLLLQIRLCPIFLVNDFWTKTIKLALKCSPTEHSKLCHNIRAVFVEFECHASEQFRSRTEKRELLLVKKRICEDAHFFLVLNRTVRCVTFELKQDCSYTIAKPWMFRFEYILCPTWKFLSTKRDWLNKKPVFWLNLGWSAYAW